MFNLSEVNTEYLQLVFLIRNVENVASFFKTLYHFSYFSISKHSSHFESFTLSRLSPISSLSESDETNRTTRNLTKTRDDNKNNEANLLEEINNKSKKYNTMSTPTIDSCDGNQQPSAVTNTDHVIKRMHSFSIHTPNQENKAQVQKLLSLNENDMDEINNNNSINNKFRDSKFKVSFDAKHYSNSSFLKEMDVSSTEDNNNTSIFSVNQPVEHYFCKRCRKASTNTNTSPIASLNMSSSLPNLLELPDSFIINKLK